MKMKNKVIIALTMLSLLVVGDVKFLKGSGVVSAAYNLIQNAGSSLVQRQTLNCSTGITCTDDSVNNRTVITASGGGGSAGGGVLGYSATALILPGAGTTYIAPVGGAAASATEGNVIALAPAAAAISNMYVTMSAAPGTGNTVTFTYRDAGSSTALTCVVSGASATTCNDTTHNFTPTVGDALSIQIVTTGTVVVTPNIKIIVEYGVVSGGGGGGPPLTPVNPAAFTWFNQQGATVSTVGTSSFLQDPVGTGQANYSIIGQAIPSAPYRLRALVQYWLINGNDTFPAAGVCVMDSVSTGIICLQFIQNGGTGVVLQARRQTSWSNGSGGNYFSYNWTGVWNGQFWLQLRDDGTNRYWDVSTDGIVFQNLGSSVDTDFITPDTIGYFVQLSTTSNFPISSISVASWAIAATASLN